MKLYVSKCRCKWFDPCLIWVVTEGTPMLDDVGIPLRTLGYAHSHKGAIDIAVKIAKKRDAA